MHHTGIFIVSALFVIIYKNNIKINMLKSKVEFNSKVKFKNLEKREE
jgi:predicted Holliday junction resolvase-like endonuclease